MYYKPLTFRELLAGFVNMMDRQDADQAKSKMGGVELFGLEMRIGWG